MIKGTKNKPTPDPDEVPALTADDFAAARRARDVFSPEAVSDFRSKGGRPRAENPKQAISIRLDRDVVAALKAGGPRWQSRANLILREAVIPSSLKRGAG